MCRCAGLCLLARKVTVLVTLVVTLVAVPLAAQECRVPQACAPNRPATGRISIATHRRTSTVKSLAWARALGTASTPSLSYYDGPVVSNPEIVVVFWGSDVDPSTVSGIGGFYDAVLDSPVMDLLGEYDTVGLLNGTNQAIGHGTLKGTYTITPSQANSGTQLYDSNVQLELLQQITDGVLPGPTFDAAGIQNTIYMIYFPPGVTITLSGPAGASCQTFCAYHGITGKAFAGRHLRYGVFPDYGPTSTCSEVCGSGSAFDNLTSFSTHELAEAVTDPVAGFYFGYPTGWYDTAHGEVADICNGNETSGASGYTVQRLWSNLQQRCTHAPAQFAVAAPSSVTPGVPFTVTVTAEDSHGNLLADYAGIATFSSSDAGALLPSNYLFDYNGGTQSFSATLHSAGVQTITVSDTRALPVRGTAMVNVVQPVGVAVGTSPAGASFSVDGVAYTTAQVFAWVPGSTHTLAEASSQTGSTGNQFRFQNWSDAGAATHAIVTPTAAMSYTAYFSVAVIPQRPERAERSTPVSGLLVRRIGRALVVRKAGRGAKDGESR